MVDARRMAGLKWSTLAKHGREDLKISLEEAKKKIYRADLSSDSDTSAAGDLGQEEPPHATLAQQTAPPVQGSGSG